MTVRVMPMNARTRMAENSVGMSRLLCATIKTMPRPRSPLNHSPTTAPIPDAPTEAELIALATQVRDKYEAVAEESAHHLDVYYRMDEALLALQGEESLANDPDVAPWHFRAAIASAKALCDEHAATVFAQIRDFLGGGG